MLSLLKKIIFSLTIIIFIFFVFSRSKVYPKNELSYGLTFSKKEAVDLGLDWKKTYTEILDDLDVKKIRLSAYWNELEKEKGADFDWTDTDWQINEASKRDAKIILAIGMRLPRWPECHIPDWAKQESADDRNEAVLKYIEKTITRYKNNESIVAWQIENEPFLKYFGECPPLEKGFLDREIALAKSLDSRPIVVTDSGELSFWIPAAKRADIFGTTLYRDTYSGFLKRYIHYPITPAFFRFKKNITALFSHPKEWIVIELQGEPWASQSFQNVSKEERNKTMNPQKFKEIIEFSSQTGFKEFYLWGAEWWYWEKETQGNPEMWEEAKKLF